MRREDVAQIFSYRGYPMRSHSETRWASMMDFFGIQWIYEPKLFETSLGLYLPDFYLPDMGAYLEVKGPFPSKEEIRKAEDVQVKTGKPVIFAHGKPAMDGLHLGGATLSSWICGKPVHLGVSEISQGIEKYLGMRDCAAFAYAGMIQKRPDFSSVGDLVDSYLRSISSRSDEEKDRSRKNKELNDQVCDFVGPMTIAQIVVFNAINWISLKIKEDANP